MCVCRLGGSVSPWLFGWLVLLASCLRWLVCVVSVCVPSCAFLSAFVCSFRGSFSCVLSWVEILKLPNIIPTTYEEDC